MDGLFQRLISLFNHYLPSNLSHLSIPFYLLISSLLFFLTTLVLFILLKQTRRDLVSKKVDLSRAEDALLDRVEQYRAVEIKAAQLETLYTSEKEHALEKLQLLKHAREELRLQFSALAQQIFDEKSTRFSELNQEKLNTILLPFKDQLKSFKQEINDIYRTDSRERISLKTEISHLKKLNQQINQEAANLTNALKNNTKIQGNWGELVLERILDNSGLRKGFEYDSQASFRDHQHRLYKPDIIVHLPAGKDIIIDSKVSLISWEKYVNCEKESDRKQFLQELCKAIRDHIHSLSGKNYPQLSGLNSLNFVLLFMPIEAAFSTACSHDRNLIDDALTNNIILVTPTTLLATLRTVENIWHNENQSKNSLEIARRAGLMFDKFRGLVEEIEKIGYQLTVCQNSYESALGKLCKGRGNLIRQAEQLKELGVQVSKEMPASITERADGTGEKLSN